MSDQNPQTTQEHVNHKGYETGFREGAAAEAEASYALLMGIAGMLDRKPAPLRAYGLDKTSHMRAAAKCLREISLMMLERSKQIKEGKI